LQVGTYAIRVNSTIAPVTLANNPLVFNVLPGLPVAIGSALNVTATPTPAVGALASIQLLVVDAFGNPAIQATGSQLEIASEWHFHWFERLLRTFSCGYARL
jgi:hypothetical protein